jgi:hypothetical protein
MPRSRATRRTVRAAASTPSLPRRSRVQSAQQYHTGTRLPIRDLGAAGMEHSRNPAGGRNRWQTGRPGNPLKQADLQPCATHGNGAGAHGNEGVDGSSPSEGSAESAARRRFLVQADLLLVECAVGMEPFMELSHAERPGAPLFDTASARGRATRMERERTTGLSSSVSRSRSAPLSLARP